MRDYSASATGSTLFVLLDKPDDPLAWATFYARYRPKIMEWCRCRGLQEADADDVAQEVMRKLSDDIRGFVYDPGKGRFRSWLKTVVMHALSDAMERRRRLGAGVGGDTALEQLQAVAAPDDLAERLLQEYRRELVAVAAERVRAEVSSRDWKIFVALAIEGRPGKEVATELGIKVATAHVARNRVQRRILDLVRQLEA